MSTISINRASFEYTEQGNGPPLIFVHGELSDLRTWKNQMKMFAKSYHVIAYSRRYHNPNTWVGSGNDYSISMHSHDLVSFMKVLNLSNVNLIGNSYGAYISLMTEIYNPGMIRTLVLNEPPVIPLLISDTNNPFQMPALFIRQFSTAKSLIKFKRKHLNPAIAAFKANNLEEGVKLFASGLLGDGEYEKLSDEIVATFMANSKALKAELLGEGFPPFLKEEARLLELPILFVYGKNSPKFLHSISNKLVDLMPNSHKVIIPNASHFTHRDNPIEYNHKVMEFLAKHL